MLRGLDPLLTPELLYVMALMGHGDEVAIVDANFPAHSVAVSTPYARVVPIAGASTTAVVRAMLSVLPLDDHVPAPVRVMSAPGPGHPVVHGEIQDLVDTVAGHPWPVEGLERFAFYQASCGCYAVVHTGESRLYGNVLIRKGVVAPGE